jgi:hypothetical protein
LLAGEGFAAGHAGGLPSSPVTSLDASGVEEPAVFEPHAPTEKGRIAPRNKEHGTPRSNFMGVGPLRCPYHARSPHDPAALHHGSVSQPAPSASQGPQ